MKLLLCFLLLMTFNSMQAQSANEYWRNGVAAFDAKEYSKAIHFFKAYDELSPQKTTAQYYLGQCYDLSQKADSAIYFYEKTMEYNKSIHANDNAIIKLSRAYLRKKDFVNAYRVSADAVVAFPENLGFALELQDACLWPYLIKNRNLNSSYLTDPIKHISYVVNTVDEQHIIVRNIINEKGIPFEADKRRNVGFAERWYGSYANDTTMTSVHFVFTTKNMSKELDEQDVNALKVFENKEAPLFERLGAMYAIMPFDKKKMAVIMEHDELMIRYCACKEMRSDIPKKYQKICENDERELIQKAVELNPAFVK